MSHEFNDGGCPRVRSAFGHLLRQGYTYQDGAESEAPALIFTDCDYEVGDGKCGLWEDGKNANEPAIVYARADAYLAVKDDAEAARRHLGAVLMRIVSRPDISHLLGPHEKQVFEDARVFFNREK